MTKETSMNLNHPKSAQLRPIRSEDRRARAKLRRGLKVHGEGWWFYIPNLLPKHMCHGQATLQ